MVDQFAKDVNEGLSASPKFLSSKYFYNTIGDNLFIQIMNLPEYYLTRAEYEIFTTRAQDLIDAFALQPNERFQLIELGAGNGKKTLELLKVLVAQKHNFEYVPVDISANILVQLKATLGEVLPSLKVSPQQGDYFNILSSFAEEGVKKIVLFLGSNIGNFRDEIASEFLRKLSHNLAPEDLLLLGVDLIKAADIVLPAYNDSQGITAQFNLNLLTRINDELGADFNLSNFKHTPEYNESEGIAKSFLQSTEKQKVTIKRLKKSFDFEAGEKIHMETSRKYNDAVLSEIMKDTNLAIQARIEDSNHYFADYILKRR